MDEKVTNKKYVSAGIALAFADFKKDHPSIVFSLKDNNIKGYSGSLSAACVVLATTYLNHIVENITNGNPKWPIKQFDLVSICKTAEVSTLCDELREKLPLPPTIGILASAPSKFGNVNAFYSIFDFQKFGYRSVEEVIAGENKFTCFILSDGFGICFGFA
ncbi:hypothetical protein HPULCUR_000074 [Helicostylum pulchrum]|uniref:Uncharacterized protein n=1 Tax=Helicostylum pulchrum TaxID=562976 RepID=A0ABP9XIT5_9FUNG